jgi:hypothetical protein
MGDTGGRRQFWAIEIPGPTDEFIHSPKIDDYLVCLKNAKLKSQSGRRQRELPRNEIPKGLESLFTEEFAPTGSKKLVRAFDDAGH